MGLSFKRKKSNRDSDLTRAYNDGEFDEDREDSHERFGSKSKHFQHHKTIRTQEARSNINLDVLPVGEVIQVHSLFSEVLYEGKIYLCTQRKTLAKISRTQIVVGDFVRFAISPERNDQNQNEGTIESLEERKTVLARADSFKAIDIHPIVANAQQMLIVAALHLPEVKWGLIDRMVIAARSGGLDPIICLNKIDTAASQDDLDEAIAVLKHYESLGIITLQTCALTMLNISPLRELLAGKNTVLAGHSGVGKSSLVRAVEPALDIRVGEISNFHNKGKHTTTSARKYPLSFGGHVIDTPGVKLFGLWQVTSDSLDEFYPDIEDQTAPQWRIDSFKRIRDSL